MNFRIKSFEFDASLTGGEAPLDWCWVGIAGRFPSRDLTNERRLSTDPAIQTLATQHAELEFGHIQPTAMFGRVMELQAVQ
jgi:hypothetical protein